MTAPAEAGLLDRDAAHLWHPYGTAGARQLYAVGIPKDHDDLVRAVNATIERIRNDGTWTRMHQQWLGDSLAEPTPPPLMYREEEQ